MRTHQKKLVKDLIYILISILIAFVAAKTGLVVQIVGALDGFMILGIFVAGMFFTSVFTTAPAMVLLGALALKNDLPIVIFVGALGAAFGDYFIFRFVRDRVADDVEYVIHATHEEKLLAIFHRRLFRWFVPFIGALIIASPLPDELGIAMLGLSKTKSKNFIFISYLFNAIGILIIGLIARS